MEIQRENDFTYASQFKMLYCYIILWLKYQVECFQHIKILRATVHGLLDHTDASNIRTHRPFVSCQRIF
jgi:hypothetical protein